MSPQLCWLYPNLTSEDSLTLCILLLCKAKNLQINQFLQDRISRKDLPSFLLNYFIGIVLVIGDSQKSSPLLAHNLYGNNKVWIFLLLLILLVSLVSLRYCRQLIRLRSDISTEVSSRRRQTDIVGNEQTIGNCSPNRTMQMDVIEEGH